MHFLFIFSSKSCVFQIFFVPLQRKTYYDYEETFSFADCIACLCVLRGE